MATLSKHGKEIGRINRLTTVRAYMDDGVVLQHDGTGWKQFGKVKPGVSPETAFANAKARSEKFLSERPCFAAYRKALHDMAPQSKRWMLHAAVEMMPGDPDGLWSELADSYDPRQRIEADLDEICALCDLYKTADLEAGVNRRAA